MLRIQFRVVCKRNNLRSTNLTKCFAIEITNNLACFSCAVNKRAQRKGGGTESYGRCEKGPLQTGNKRSSQNNSTQPYTHNFTLVCATNDCVERSGSIYTKIIDTLIKITVFRIPAAVTLIASRLPVSALAHTFSRMYGIYMLGIEARAHQIHLHLIH